MTNKLALQPLLYASKLVQDEARIPPHQSTERVIFFYLPSKRGSSRPDF